MKAIPCKLQLVTRLGHVCARLPFNSVRAAKAYAMETINNGFAFSYKIEK